MACHPSDAACEGEELRQFDLFLAEQSDSISLAPARLRTRAFQRMRQTTDSVAYYSYMMVALKACLAPQRLDSAYMLMDRIDGFVQRMPVTPRLADLRSEVLNMRGNVCARFAGMDSAVVYFTDAYRWRLRGKRIEAVPDILMNLADAYNRLGNQAQGAATYRRALFLVDSLGLAERQKTPIYYGLAQIYTALRDFDTCDHYYDLAACRYNAMLPFEKTIYLNNRGTSYYFRGDYTEALGYFKQLQALVQDKPEMEFELHLSEVNQSDCYLQLGKADSASYYLGACEAFFNRLPMPTAHYYLATQHIQLALMQGNYPAAKRLFLSSKVTPDIDPDMVHIRNKNLQRYFEETGDYRKAYHYLQQNQLLDDSLRNERIKMRTADLALRYQQDSTLLAKNILIQQQRNRVLSMQKNRILWLAVTLAILLAVAAILLYNKKKHQAERERNRRMVSSLRLENIRNRLSPHFIFNILSQHVSGQHADEQKDLMGLVKLMRRNLELAEQLSVTLREEMDFVTTYIDLERKSLGEQFVCEVHIGADVDADSVRLPSMMLQIPVENAIKHALRGKEGVRLLRIVVERDGEAVRIRVTDNGGGFRPASAQRGAGIGMREMMQTVQLLNRRNKESIEVEVANVPVGEGETGCEVRFRVPLQYRFELK